MSINKLPKVTVCVVTYNQKNYIRECLQSIVDQATNFNFEVIVGDDCSQDGTRDVVREFADNYPNLIKPLFHEKNLGATQNYFTTHNAARGQYIAHIDGDDLMLPGKLQKQAEFLDQYSECAFVSHDVRIFDGKTGKTISKNFADIKIPEITNIEFLVLNGCYFSHCSKMYRRSAVITQHTERPSVDFFIHVEHASNGPIGYIDEVLGEYRKLPGTLSDRASVFNSQMVSAYYEAYERALELGVDPAVVARGRLLYNYSQAYSAIIANDLETFKKTVLIDNVARKYATGKHRLFHALRHFPVLVKSIIKSKEFIRQQLSHRLG